MPASVARAGLGIRVLVPRTVGGLGYAGLSHGAVSGRRGGDVSAHDDAVTQGHLCLVRGASLSGRYGTLGRSPSGGRGRHGVGQRGDPGSGAGHWGHSRERAQAWPRPTCVPSVGVLWPKGNRCRAGSHQAPWGPCRQQGSMPRPSGPLEVRPGSRGLGVGRKGQRRQEPWALLQIPQTPWV